MYGYQTKRKKNRRHKRNKENVKIACNIKCKCIKINERYGDPVYLLEEIGHSSTFHRLLRLPEKLSLFQTNPNLT